MTQIEIKRITQATPQVEEAFAQLLPQLSDRLGALSLDRIRAVVESPQTYVFGAYCSERIVGLTSLAWYDVPSGRKAWIEDVVVERTMRGRGVGQALIEQALRLSRELGVGKVMLTSSAHRQAAHALYRKMGFDVAQTTLFGNTNKIK